MLELDLPLELLGMLEVDTTGFNSSVVFVDVDEMTLYYLSSVACNVQIWPIYVS